MGKCRSLETIVLALVAGFLLTPSCKRAPQRRLPPAGEVRGDLAILHAAPSGPAQRAGEADEIVVVFDHPMSALEPLPVEERAPLVVFDPPVAGRARWMGTRTLAFRPKTPLPFGTDFRATVPAGTSSVDGYVLPADYAWTFATPRPRLVRQAPQPKERQLRLDTEIVLGFNQPMDAGRAGRRVELMSVGEGGDERTVRTSLRRPTAAELEAASIGLPPDHVLVVRPAEKLKPDHAYVVRLAEGLPGRDGTLGLETPVSFAFETFKTFRFVGLGEGEEQSPEAPLKLVFSNRVPYKEIVRRLTFEPKVEIPAYYEDWEEGSETLWLDLPLEPETGYKVAIDAGLRDEFGNALGAKAEARFTTSAFTPSIRMTDGPGVVEAGGDLSYPLTVRNVEEAKLQAAPVPPDGVVPLLASPRVFSSQAAFTPPGGWAAERTLTFPGPRNKTRYVPLRFGELLPRGRGFLFLQLDTGDRDKWLRWPKAMLQVTDLSVTGKFAPDGAAFWITELRSGQPAAGSEVELRDDANRVLWRGRTDAAGLAEAPGWKAFGLTGRDPWSKPRQWVLARRGPDAALLSSDWGTGLDPYRFDIDYDWRAEPQAYDGAVFTDRGIYRAGETVRLKGVLRHREKGRWALPGLKAVAAEIKDPFEKTVLKTTAALDAFGSFALDLPTAPEAALGTYLVSLAAPPGAPRGEALSVEDTFRVEAFRPAEFELHLKAAKDGLVFGDAYQADIRASYLYGGAMAGQKARWTLRLNPSSYAPPGHEGFLFGDEIESEEPREASRLLGSGEAALGPDGNLGVRVPLVAAKDDATSLVTLEATVASPSRREVSDRISTLVHRGEFYIGLKPSSTFIRKGEKVSVEVLTASPDGGLVPDRRVRLRLLRREWRSARKAALGGRYEWVSERIDTEAAAAEVRTGREPVSASFTPEAAGLYLIEARADDARRNPVLTSIALYATGPDYVAWQRTDDDALELVADAKSYAPGRTARILVKSPYEKAKALVTVERELVLRAEVVEITGSAQEIEVPITAEMMPNAYVSVILVQGRTTRAGATDVDDPGKPSFKIGYVGLDVDSGAKRLAVEVASDRPVYKPRQTVEIRIKVRDAAGRGVPSSVALAVADVGVLNLIGYRAPDLFARFWGPKPLGVQTAEGRLHVVGQRHYGEKGEDPGGGAGAAAAPLSLAETELRGDFRSTAYWNPDVRTNAAGEASVRFELPDNLTAFRVMAAAQTLDSSFGNGEATFRVSKPLMLLPSLPRFARLGDAFSGGVVVTNQTDRPGRVTVEAKARDLLLRDASPRREIDLPPGQSREILFDCEADRPGRAALEFRAVMGAESDGFEGVVPVGLPRPVEAVAAFAATDGAAEERLSLPDSVYPDLTSLEIRVSGSALSGLQTALDHLKDYPYACLEQKLSSVLPYLLAVDLIRDFRIPRPPEAEIRSGIVSVLEAIASCRTDSGGFGLWPDSVRESPFVSAYAVFALLEARRAGFRVDAGLLDDGLRYLKNFLAARFDAEASPEGQAAWGAVQAFALYDLALAGQPDHGYLEKLFARRAGLPIFGQAFLLKAAAAGGDPPGIREALARELLNKAKATPSETHFEEMPDDGLRWIYSSDARATAVALQALVEAGSESPLLGGAARWLAAGRGKTGRWPSTQDNVFVLYALNDAYALGEGGRPDFSARVALAGKPLLEGRISSPQASLSSRVRGTDLGTANDAILRLEKTGTGRLFYGLRLFYAPKDKLPSRDEGLAVYETLSTTDGTPLADVKAGSLAVVTLQVIVPKDSLFVVVDDPLPAGFEAVQTGFLTESEEARRRLEEMEGPEPEPWWRGFRHVEMRDDRVLLFADSLDSGIHTYRFLVRALTPGLFKAPGAKAEQMYAPEVFGRAAEREVRIRQ